MTDFSKRRRGKKKISFEDFAEQHASLKIRLNYDGVKQGEFFRAILDAYVNKNEHILNFIEEYKKQKQIHSDEKRAKSKKLVQKGKEITTKFALNEDEIESIFDLIAEEHPDL